MSGFDSSGEMLGVNETVKTVDLFAEAKRLFDGTGETERKKGVRLAEADNCLIVFGVISDKPEDNRIGVMKIAGGEMMIAVGPVQDDLTMDNWMDKMPDGSVVLRQDLPEGNPANHIKAVERRVLDSKVRDVKQSVVAFLKPGVELGLDPKIISNEMKVAFGAARERASMPVLFAGKIPESA